MINLNTHNNKNNQRNINNIEFQKEKNFSQFKQNPDNFKLFLNKKITQDNYLFSFDDWEKIMQETNVSSQGKETLYDRETGIPFDHKTEDLFFKKGNIKAWEKDKNLLFGSKNFLSPLSETFEITNNIEFHDVIKKKNKNNWQKIINETNIKAKNAFSNCFNIHDLIVTKNHLIGTKSDLALTFKKLSKEEKKKNSREFKKIKLQIKIMFLQFKKIKNLKKKIIILEKQIAETQIIKNIFDQKNIKKINNNQFLKLNQNLLTMKFKSGDVHPLNMIVEEIHQFCNYMQWKFVDCENLTSVTNNFALLNIGVKHPARKASDCFYINEDYLLRTHATNNTAKILKNYQKNQNKEQCIYTVGNVYRNDTDDATHLPQFSQFDVCLIKDNLSLAHLKGILIQFCQFLFNENIKYRFRSSYFPFTEPSLEMDIHCTFCDAKGCRVCKNEGWIELLGGGIISPPVLEKCNIETNKNILAFGIGIERIVMLKYKITDIRFLYQNNLIRKRK